MPRRNPLPWGAAPIDPADPYQRRAHTFPRLTDDQVARARAFGVVEELPKGTVLFKRGDRTVDFFVVLQGFIEIYEHTAAGPVVFTIHAEIQFTGELDLFNDREILVGGRMPRRAGPPRARQVRRACAMRASATPPAFGGPTLLRFCLAPLSLPRRARGRVPLLGPRLAVAQHGHVRIPAGHRAEGQRRSRTVAGGDVADPIGGGEGDLLLACGTALPERLVGAHGLECGLPLPRPPGGAVSGPLMAARPGRSQHLCCSSVGSQFLRVRSPRCRIPV
jgi:hypothetical protein